MKKTILIPLLLIVNLSFAQLKMGEKAPDFKLWLINNNIISNNETKNKVVVFKFWFTSYFICITAILMLNKLKDILFIAPVLDNKEKVKRFLAYYPFILK